MDGFHGDPVVLPLVVQTAVFFMALQALLSILYGYFAGTFMVIGRAHVGAYWNNAKNLILIGTALVAVLLRGNFAAGCDGAVWRHRSVSRAAVAAPSPGGATDLPNAALLGSQHRSQDPEAVRILRPDLFEQLSGLPASGFSSCSVRRAARW